MEKVFVIDIRSTGSGDKWRVEAFHDGVSVPDTYRGFNHLYRGKAPNRKMLKTSRQRAEEYIEELKAQGYTFGGHAVLPRMTFGKKEI